MGSTRRELRPWMGFAGAVLGLALGAGCSSVGPRAIRGGRLDYNEAVVQSFNEQMLLNLVRLRYRDTPFFLQVSSVSTQHTLSSSLGASTTFLTDGSQGDQAGASGGVEYSERPTVTYAPLQGEDFVRQILTPIAPQSLVLLARSGWSLERVLRCCVERLGGVRNAPSASGPTPDHPPEWEAFARLGRALRRLQRQDALVLAFEPDSQGLVLRFAPAADERDLDELRAVLGLAEDAREAHFPAAGTGGAGPLATRSLLGTLFFLSQAVEPPAADRERGLVTVTRAPDGAVFDWGRVTGGLMRIRSAAQEPAGAFVRVRYRGSWFWIADDDLDSKTTFELLVYLFNLQAGEAQSFSPLLTLPVGG